MYILDDRTQKLSVLMQGRGRSRGSGLSQPVQLTARRDGGKGAVEVAGFPPPMQRAASVVPFDAGLCCWQYPMQNLLAHTL
jgi:hypothetical protein